MEQNNNKDTRWKLVACPANVYIDNLKTAAEYKKSYAKMVVRMQDKGKKIDDVTAKDILGLFEDDINAEMNKPAASQKAPSSYWQEFSKIKKTMMV